jgi:hypothetical protein
MPLHKPRRGKLVASDDLKRLTVMLIHVLDAGEFLDRCCVKDSDETNHRIFRHLILQARDAEFWQGMLRKWLW